MSKNIQQTPAKTVKKAVQQRITDELKAITKELGLDFEKLKDEAEKGTKKLVKIIARELKASRPVNKDAASEPKAAINAKTQASKENIKKSTAPAKPAAAANGKAVAKEVAPKTAPSKTKPVKEAVKKTSPKNDGALS
jgi:hypothetical protein